MASDGKVVIGTEIDQSGANKGMNELESNISKSGSKIGKTMTTALKGTAVAIGAVGTAVAGLSAKAVKSYAEFEQLVGGVETLFKDSASIVRNYADNAYKTAGLSANKYMETVTSFSASLLQSLDGDTKKAAEAANQAVIDMADNANKMGTDIERIQDAYQGFAKQNYTMLDNLKLGYGGTKEEMERLLEDAEKLTGIHYDISNLNDVYSAIHVIQTEIGITGTTAKEAAATIEGSVNAMKGSWSNLVTGIADDNANMDMLINNFVESAGTAFQNILPRVEQAFNGIAKLVEKIFPIIVNRIPQVLNTVIPQLVSSSINIVKAIAQGIIQQAPVLLQTGYDMLNNLINGFVEGVPTMLPKILDFVQKIGENIATAAPVMIQKGFELLSKLVEGIVTAIPILIAKVPTIISTFANVINDNFPTILMKGVQLIGQLVIGIIQAIPTLVANIPKIITAIVDVWEAFNWLDLGRKAINFMKDGIMSMVTAVGNAGKSVFNAIKNAITNLPSTLANIGRSATQGLGNAIRGAVSHVKSAAMNIVDSVVSTFKSLPGKMLDIGRNLVRGLWNGISDMTGWVIGKIQSFGDTVLGGIKDFFGIHSPSKVMEVEVGQWLAKGIGVGFEKYNPMVQIQRSLDVGLRGLESSLFGGVTNNNNQTNNFYGVQTPDQISRSLRLQQIYGLAGAR